MKTCAVMLILLHMLLQRNWVAVRKHIHLVTRLLIASSRRPWGLLAEADIQMSSDAAPNPGPRTKDFFGISSAGKVDAPSFGRQHLPTFRPVCNVLARADP